MTISRRQKLAQLLGGNLGQAALNAVAALLIARWLVPDDRGIYVTIVAVASLVGMVAGLGSGIGFRVYFGRGENSAGMRGSYAILSLALSVASALMAGLLVALWYVTLGGGEIVIGYVVGGALAGSSICFQMQCSEAWFASGEFGAGVKWPVFGSVLAVVGILLMSTVSSAGWAMLIVQMIGNLIASAFSFVVLLNRGFLGLLGFSKMEGLKLVRYGMKTLPWSIGLLLISRLDRIVLGIFVSPATVSSYALAVTFAEFLRMVPTAVAQFSLNDSVQGIDSAVLRRQAKLSVLAVVVAGFFGLGAMYILVDLLLHPDYRAAVGLAAILLVGEIGMVFFFVGSKALQASGAAGFPSRVSLTGGCLSIPVFLIAGFLGGATGVAWGMSVLYLAIGMSVWLRAVSKRRGQRKRVHSHGAG
ncbi:hypothetical protein O4162_16740 [Dietzia maris]|uniref:lipopolysaccharide biosynthesis protein n=1 Tax=Dietzia maris TaxID=37915 RepID=UPI0022B42DE1|nr:hypothetical protein [Dietzia maris]MCZ4541779.1 hypothetical protein [Dietzia maris]